LYINFAIHCCYFVALYVDCRPIHERSQLTSHRSHLNNAETTKRRAVVLVTFMAPKDPVPAENGEVSLSCVSAAEEFEDANLRGEA